jgi:hypothetical protein
MSNPFTLALGIAAVAAIAIMVVAIMKHKKATEDTTTAQMKLTEAQRENEAASADYAKAHAKLINSWLEEMKTMDGLIAKYKKLKAAKDEEGAADTEAEILENKDNAIKSYEDMAKKGGLSAD